MRVSVEVTVAHALIREAQELKLATVEAGTAVVVLALRRKPMADHRHGAVAAYRRSVDSAGAVLRSAEGRSLPPEIR